MPVFLLPLLNMLGACKACRAVLVGLLAFGALAGFIIHEKHKAVAAYVAAQEKATAAESARRREVIAMAQGRAEAAATTAATMEKRNATLKSEIVRLSARRDRAPCLDADGVRRLREVGQPPGR